MAEAPCIMFETPENEEKSIINKELVFKEMKFNFSINRINEDQIKFILLNKEIKDYKKYYNIFSLDNFKNMNKYFKMFDELSELENDLISIIKDNNIEIINVTKNEISINLKVLSRNDNIVTIKLKKAEIEEKDKINILFEKFEELKQNNEIKDKKINELENKISIILKEMDEKNRRIESLENDINEIKKNFNKFKEEINQNISKAKSKLTNPIFDNILKNSNIFQDEDDIKLLLNNISNNPKDLKLLYNSKVDGENEEKLINTYTEKNDLIILVKTDKSKRFGGYAHESFEKNNFKKSDINAFLFNLDKKKFINQKEKNFQFGEDIILQIL